MVISIIYLNLLEDCIVSAASRILKHLKELKYLQKNLNTSLVFLPWIYWVIIINNWYVSFPWMVNAVKVELARLRYWARVLTLLKATRNTNKYSTTHIYVNETVVLDTLVDITYCMIQKKYWTVSGDSVIAVNECILPGTFSKCLKCNKIASVIHVHCK